MTGGTLRVAGNSAASTLNVGPGGITASGGVIEVKFNTNNQDAVVNLGGDFTVTANLAVNNADYTGANLNVFNLTGTRTFTIADLTTTTFKPDLAGPGSLVKAGLGTLVLTPLCAASYAGDTMVNAGTLEVQGTVDGANTVISGGTLAGNGGVSASGTVGIDLNAGGKISPGTTATPIGTLAMSSSVGEVNVVDAVTPAASGALVFDLDTPVASDKISINLGALNIGSGVLGIDDFAFTLKPGFGVGTYTLFQSTTAILGTLASNVTATIGGFKATLAKSADTFALELVVAPLTTPLQAWRQLHFGSPDNVGDGANDADPDHDGVPNLGEYVFGTLPKDAGSTSGLVNLAAATNLTAEYTRLLAANANVDVIAQYSDNLTSWDSTTATQTIINTTATPEMLRVSIPAAVNARFIRLKFVEK
jgi:autotransporter-associated beta strand protein